LNPEDTRRRGEVERLTPGRERRLLLSPLGCFPSRVLPERQPHMLVAESQRRERTKV